MPVTPEIDARLSAIMENRLLAHGLEVAANLEGTYAEPILKAVDRSIRDVKRLLTADALTDFQEQRYRAMLKWLSDTRAELQKTVKVTTSDLKNDLADFAQTEGNIYSNIMSFDGRVSGFNTVGISAAQARAMVNTPAGGFLLEQWLENLGTNIARRSYLQVQQSILRGETMRQVTSRIAMVAELSRRDAITIARTQVQTISQEAARMVREANLDIVNGVEWSAVWDNRLCPRCAPLDGQRFYYSPKPGMRSIGNMPPIPLHARCRCAGLPVTKSFGELMGVDSTAKLEAIENDYKPYSIREHYKRTGKVKRVDVGGAKIVQAGQFRGSAEQWLKEFPQVAKDVLGTKRAELVLSGKVRLRDLMEKPGELWTLKQLKQKYGLE